MIGLEAVWLRPRERRVLLLVLLVLTGGTVSARTNFILENKGQHLPGGEVCFYKTAEDLNEAHPSQFWFHSNDVRCLSADLLIELPAGRFHYFGRHADGYASAHDYFFIRQSVSSPDTYKEIAIDLQPAGTADLTELRSTLQPREWIAFLTPDTEQYAGSMVPVPDGVNEVLLPANMPVLALIVSDRMPSRIGKPFTMRTGERQMIRVASPADGRGDVLTWLELDYAFIQASGAAGSLVPITVHIANADGGQMRPVFPVRWSRTAYGKLQIFKDVPSGTATLQIDSDRWEKDELTLTVQPRTLTTTPRGLRTAPAAVLHATYAPPPSAVPLSAAKRKTCASTSADDAEVRFTLYRCPSNTAAVADCTVARTATAPVADAMVTFPQLTVGNYIAHAEYPGLGIASRSASLAPSAERTLILEPFAFPVLGRVIRNGEPSLAMLTFAAGSGFETTTTTGDDGAYQVLLAGDPKRSSVLVTACDQSYEYVHLPEQSFVPNATHDIFIPNTGVRVTITDAVERRPLPQTVARLIVFRKDGSRPLTGRRGETTADGRVLFEALPAGHPLQVCAQRQGYRQACSERFTLEPDDRHSVALALSKEGILRGRVEPTGHFDYATLYWVAATGEVTEEVRIEPDGSFSYTRPRTPLEYAVIASTTRPLYLLTEWTANTDGEITLRVPTVPARSVRVHLATADDSFPTRFVGITIAGRRVPLNALVFHLANRRTGALVHRDVPLLIPDIAMTGPTTVLLGPSPKQLPPGTPPEQVFLRPELAPLIRELPASIGTDDVVFR